MSLYAIAIGQEYALIPTIIIGWDDEDDFYIELVWLNLGLGVVFG